MLSHPVIHICAVWVDLAASTSPATITRCSALVDDVTRCRVDNTLHLCLPHCYRIVATSACWRCLIPLKDWKYHLDPGRWRSERICFVWLSFLTLPHFVESRFSSLFYDKNNNMNKDKHEPGAQTFHYQVSVYFISCFLTSSYVSGSTRIKR